MVTIKLTPLETFVIVFGKSLCQNDYLLINMETLSFSYIHPDTTLVGVIIIKCVESFQLKWVYAVHT